MEDCISIRGARENNLKNVSLDIPRNQLTVFTGISGAGKSSLAFDVLYGVGQRKLLESLSTYARSRIPQLRKPDVDFVFGLSPVAVIEQKKGIENPRSTVGTITDISDYIRLLFASVGSPVCPYCGHTFKQRSATQIADRLEQLPEGSLVEVLAPMYQVQGESDEEFMTRCRMYGCEQVRRINHYIPDQEFDEPTAEVVIQQFAVGDTPHRQIEQIICSGMKKGEGFCKVEIVYSTMSENEYNRLIYGGVSCEKHHIFMGDLLPYFFTPNEIDSACLVCKGLGRYHRYVKERVVFDGGKSIQDGALPKLVHSWKNDTILMGMAQRYGFRLDTPFNQLNETVQDMILNGNHGETFLHGRIDGKTGEFFPNGHSGSYPGVYQIVEDMYKRTFKLGEQMKPTEMGLLEKVSEEDICPECHGTKLIRQHLMVTINGQNIYQLGQKSIYRLFEFFKDYMDSSKTDDVSRQIVKEIIERLEQIINIGLDYLNLNRNTDSISGGELQRLCLSKQINSGLVGMLYVLDEPSIGLHAKDSEKIIQVLKHLRDSKNTVIVVEHDLDTIRQADYIVEVGPQAGVHGGHVMATGSVEEIKENPNSITGQYLSGKKQINLPQKRRPYKNRPCIQIRNAAAHNLQHVNVDIPLNVFTCITGVSGSGKSTLINDVMYQGIHSLKKGMGADSKYAANISGQDYINGIFQIDQSPIGRTPRSNPATYVGVFDRIRALFAATEKAQKLGLDASSFSSNSVSGRCDECQGLGYLNVALQFMPDIQTTCPVCKGNRFKPDLLQVTYRGKNVVQVLDMPVEEAAVFFSDERLIRSKLDILNQMGLGYLKLGQSCTTISGGEAQRIKLATELGKLRPKSNYLYILDEPTTGLHIDDIQRLLDCLERLVKAGNTVLVIEHNLDVIKMADYIIDMGPGGGEYGGCVVAKGTPEDIMETSGSYTGQYLKKYLPGGC